jgi:hypothetical protein
MSGFTLREATREDVPAIFSLVKGLALYEKSPDAVLATEDVLRENIFERQQAHVVLACVGQEAVGMALYVNSYDCNERNTLADGCFCSAGTFLRGQVDEVCSFSFSSEEQLSTAMKKVSTSKTCS